ncbi:MAG: peroxiredoxin family protein [Promethearchaeota archaeon]
MKLQTNILLIILIVLTVSSASGVLLESSSVNIVRATSNDHTVSDFELTNIWDNEPFSLTSFTDVGTVVIIQFFATWCGYCHNQLDALSEIGEWGDDKVAIVSVSIDSTDGATNPSTGNTKLYDDAVAHDMDWYVALDTADLWTGKPNPDFFGELVASRWGIPTMLIVSPTRELSWWQVGYSGSEYDTLVTEIEALLPTDVATTGWNVSIMVLLVGISFISLFVIRKKLNSNSVR